MKFPTLRSYLFISQTLICFLPHGCGGGGGGRPCAPPLRAPPSARLLGAVEQGELPQLLLSDLVVVVLWEQRTACLTHTHEGKKKKQESMDICLLMATDAHDGSKCHQIQIILTRTGNTCCCRQELNTQWKMFPKRGEGRLEVLGKMKEDSWKVITCCLLHFWITKNPKQLNNPLR